VLIGNYTDRTIYPGENSKGNTFPHLGAIKHVTLYGSVLSREQVRALLFFFTLVTGPRRSLRLKLSGTRVSNTSPPQVEARFDEYRDLWESPMHWQRHWVKSAGISPSIDYVSWEASGSTQVLFFFITNQPRVEGAQLLGIPEHRLCLLGGRGVHAGLLLHYSPA